MERAVPKVLRLVWKIELRGQDRALRRLHLEVIVARAPGIESRHDGAEAVAAFRIREDMAAKAEAPVVVVPAIVGVPKLEQRARDRAATAGEHVTRKLGEPSAPGRHGQVETFRRARLEKRTLDLRQRRRVTVLAGRRQGQLL